MTFATTRSEDRCSHPFDQPSYELHLDRCSYPFDQPSTLLMRINQASFITPDDTWSSRGIILTRRFGRRRGPRVEHVFKKIQDI